MRGVVDRGNRLSRSSRRVPPPSSSDRPFLETEFGLFDARESLRSAANLVICAGASAWDTAQNNDMSCLWILCFCDRNVLQKFYG